MGGMLAFTAVFAAALWYFQNYAYYSVTTPKEFGIRLTLSSGGEPVPILADDFTVLDAGTSPLKFRACFHVGNSIPMMTETYKVFDTPTPLQPPSWFTCFDAGQLSEDLSSGDAIAFLSEKNILDGVDRVIAVYGDGRAYAWHQLNKKYVK